MRMDPLPHEVREMVTRTFQDFGAEIFCSQEIDESVMIDGGRYAARTYRANGLMAMWLIPVGIVQFYDSDGNMLLTVNVSEELHVQRMAA